MRSSALRSFFRPSNTFGCCLAVLPLLVACSGPAPVGDARNPGGNDPGAPGGPAAGESDGGDAALAAIKWEKAATIDAAGGIEVEAMTTEACCLTEDPIEAAPARFFMGNSTGTPFGLLAYLGADDRVIVAAMTGPDVPPTTIWTSPAAATRSATSVTMAIPVEVVPGGTLKLWAGRGAPLQIGGKALPEQTADGSVPFVLIKTGRPDGAAGAAPVTAVPATVPEGEADGAPEPKEGTPPADPAKGPAAPAAAPQ